MVKLLLHKAQTTKEGFWLGLLSYHMASLEGNHSPSELLMSRGIRTLVQDLPGKTALPVQKHAQSLKKGRYLKLLHPGDTFCILNNEK